jgi:asparagine synthase (glutamine-hydrolysing)
MLFTAYLGTDTGLDPWRDALVEHARWLGLRTRVETRPLLDGRALSLAWLEHPAVAGRPGALRETDHLIVASTGVPDGGTPGDDANTATLTASLPAGDLRIVVPPTSPQQFCYAVTRHGTVFADDVRLYPRLMSVDLDERAVYALLRYGAVPAPFTVYAQVRRVPNGHSLRLPPAGQPECTPLFRLTDLSSAASEVPPPDTRVADALDATLAGVPASTVLYFSGGVDSALLAARLNRLGRRDVRLVNYSFGPDDEESRLALRVASHFGFDCHQVHHDLRKVGDVLQRVGTDYTFPFADISAIPTNILVHEALPFAGESRTILEGTGADGAHGLGTEYGKWRRVYGTPRPLRRAVGAAYRGLDLWKYNSLLERIGRLFSRSAHLPMGHAFVAQNAFDRVAYVTPPTVQADVERAVATTIETVSAGTEPRDRLSWLDLVWVCAGRMAPKSFDPLRAQGIRPLYPYLQPSVVSVSSALSWDVKCTAGESKALLKRLLVRDLPPDLVYRRKIGFSRPAHATFALASVQECLRDVVLSRNNVLLDYCRPRAVRALVERSPRHCLGTGAYSFLWTLLFSSAWLRQIAIAPARPSLRGPAVASAPAPR